MIESMACGTPVIATRWGAVPEVIEHGRSGIIVDDYRQMAGGDRGGRPARPAGARPLRARSTSRPSGWSPTTCARFGCAGTLGTYRRNDWASMGVVATESLRHLLEQAFPDAAELDVAGSHRARRPLPGDRRERRVRRAAR